MLTIVGLGPGDPGLLTRRAWDVLTGAEQVLLRTRIHPTVEHLPDGPEYESFDTVYESAEDFARLYDDIALRVVEEAAGANVVYAVPGDPMVAEGTVARILSMARQRDIPIDVVNGVSFVEPTLAALAVDALPGLQLVDALDVAAGYHPPINPDHPALIAQLYARTLASDVKLVLMNQYPDEHPVRLVHAAGTPDEKVADVSLYEIDRQASEHLTSLYVPPLAASYPRMAGDHQPVMGFEGFQSTIAYLRAPEGCPWDREQTHQSLRKNLLEETYEVLDAIDADDPDRLREELGDLLLQVVLHTQIAIEAGEFYMGEVIRQIDDKLKRRHPHVWGSVDVNGDPDQVSVNWDEIKAQERVEKGEAERSALDGVPRTMPALAQAHEYDLRAIHVGFDWPELTGVIEKVREEIREVLEAETDEGRFHEIGDLLLVTAVWARWLGVNPEDALRAANRRFYERFSYIESKAREQGRSMTDMTLDEMDVFWDEVKARQNAQNNRGE